MQDMGKPATRRRLLAGLAAAALALPRVSRADALDPARQLFARYVALEAAFDPALAELYSDRAVIRVRRYDNGAFRDVTIPAPRYKQSIRSALPVAKSRNDVNRYSEVSFAAEGPSRVRIAATRYSVLKRYASAIRLVVAPDNGQWAIVEESSESMH